MNNNQLSEIQVSEKALKAHLKQTPIQVPSNVSINQLRSLCNQHVSETDVIVPFNVLSKLLQALDSNSRLHGINSFKAELTQDIKMCNTSDEIYTTLNKYSLYQPLHKMVQSLYTHKTSIRQRHANKDQ